MSKITEYYGDGRFMSDYSVLFTQSIRKSGAGRPLTELANKLKADSLNENDIVNFSIPPSSDTMSGADVRRLCEVFSEALPEMVDISKCQIKEKFGTLVDNVKDQLKQISDLACKFLDVYPDKIDYVAESIRRDFNISTEKARSSALKLLVIVACCRILSVNANAF